MAYNSGPGRFSEDSSASIAWSISFGDLLTLLVCFFLVLTQGTLVFPKNSAKDEPLTSSVAHVQGDGIDLANQPPRGPDVQSARLVITQPAVGQQEGWGLAQEIDAAVSKLLEQAKGIPGRCSARLCSAAGREAVASQISTLFMRSRQLCSSWELETGGSCEGEPEGVKGDVVAIVEFSVT